MKLNNPEDFEKEGMCPECRNQVFLNKSGWYECQFCDWADISLPETFFCYWCGAKDIEAIKKTINGEGICRECQNLV